MHKASQVMEHDKDFVWIALSQSLRTLEEDAESSRRAENERREEELRKQLRRLNQNDLEKLAGAGALTDDVKETFTRRTHSHDRRKLTTSCLHIVSNNPPARALLSSLAKKVEHQKPRNPSRRQAAGTNTELCRHDQATNTDSSATAVDTPVSSVSPDNLPANTRRQEAGTNTELCRHDQATNTDSLATAVNTFVYPNTHSGANTHTHALVHSVTDTPADTPVHSCTDTPADTPAPGADGEDVSYDCVEKPGPAREPASENAESGRGHQASGDSDIGRLETEMQTFRSEVARHIASLQNEMERLQSTLIQYSQLQSRLIDDNMQTRHMFDGLRNFSINTRAEQNASIDRLNSDVTLIKFLMTQPLSEAHRELANRSTDSRSPGLEERSVRLGIMNPSDSASTSGRSSSLLLE